jgi:hypothetical protein
LESIVEFIIMKVRGYVVNKTPTPVYSSVPRVLLPHAQDLLLYPESHMCMLDSQKKLIYEFIYPIVHEEVSMVVMEK